MEADKGVGKVPGYRERVLLVFDRLPLADFGNQMPLIEIDITSSTGDVTLQTIVDDINALVSIPAADADTSALATQIVRGFAASRVTTARAVIDTLRTPFFFDVAETQGKLIFKFRGGTSVVTLAEDQLGAGDGGASKELLVKDERTQEIELPEIVLVTYPDVTLDNQTGTANIKRNQVSTPTVNEFSIEVAVLLNPKEALAIAAKVLYLTWANRISYSWTTLFEHIDIDPTDVITVIVNGISHEILVTRVNMGANNLLQFDGVSNDVESNVSEDNFVPPDDVGFGTQTIKIPGPISFEIIDVALLRNAHDAPTVYAVTAGDNFIGSSVWFSLNGTDYILGERFLVRGIIGTVINNVPNYTCFGLWDEVSSIDITVSTGDLLFNEVKIDVYNADNIGLFGDEVIGFRNALLIDVNTYRLSGLLRGLRGTDWAASTHVVGERFVTLKLGGSTKPLLQHFLSDVNSSIDYKAIPAVSGDLDTVSAISRTFLSRNLKPLSPTKIKGTWDGSDNLTITWVRRARVDTGWTDFGDLAIDEPTEKYELDIFTSDGTTFLRTITDVASVNGSVVTAFLQSASYDNADQTTDGITAGDPILANVYQMSSRVGRGFVGSRVLDETPNFVSLPDQSIIVPTGNITLSEFDPIVEEA